MTLRNQFITFTVFVAILFTVGSARAAPPADAGTKDQVEALKDSRLFDKPTLLLGPDASEAKLHQMMTTGALREFDYLHMATHAIPNNFNGENSCLILSQIDLPDPLAFALDPDAHPFDGRLTMREVLRDWDIDAELVTLSACETGLGRRLRGEGYLGFAHAFFRAGARTVIVSLWKVGDDPSRRLMTRFYENMIDRDMAKAIALKEAKTYVRSYETRDGRTPYAHPAFWSGFVLIGSPK